MPFSNENIYMLAGYHSPEKLALLKRVFDAACEEGKIPLAAKAKRTELAETLLAAAIEVDREPELLLLARKSMGTYRPRVKAEEG